MWTYGGQDQKKDDEWSYPQIAAAVAAQKKSQQSPLAGLLGVLGGFAGALGEDSVGTSAPNTSGMEGMDLDTPSMPVINAPEPGLAWQSHVTPTLPSESLGGHPYQAPSAPIQSGGGQMVPMPIGARGYGPPAPGDPFQHLQNDPQLVNRISGGKPSLDPSQVESVVLHDRGGSYNGKSPYHIEVLPNGQIVQSYAGNQKAPHAYKMNPRSLSVAYGGQVGAIPTQAARSSLQRVLEGLKMHNPALRFEGHGEAFQRTRGTPSQASRSGRSLNEARWRRFF